MTGSTCLLWVAVMWCAVTWKAVAEEDTPEKAPEIEQAVAPQEASDVMESIVWIEVDEDKPFPALFSRREGNENAILLLHDITSFANDPTLIRPLHQALPSQGWDTLVPRLPVPPRVAKPDYFQKLLTAQSQRLLTAISFLRKNDYRKIVIVGHGFGSFTAIMLMSHPTLSIDPVTAIINLNTDWYNYSKGRRVLLQAIPKLSIPMLDIYSTHSHANTVHNASNRKFVLQKLAAKDNLLSRQVSIPHRPHSMKDAEHILLRIMNRWLQYVISEEE